MGTSKSSEQGKFVAGVSIFSGRRDPTWSVSDSIAERLKSLWGSLEKFDGPIPQPLPLGYRGCFLKNIDGQQEWLAYKGVVTLKMDTGDEARSDESREFESLLLKSAPAGTIPPEILASEGL